MNNANELFDNLLALIDRDAPLSSISEMYIRVVLARMDGNKLRAARVLDIDRRTIQRHEKMRNMEVAVSIAASLAPSSPSSPCAHNSIVSNPAGEKQCSDCKVPMYRIERFDASSGE